MTVRHCEAIREGYPRRTASSHGLQLPRGPPLGVRSGDAALLLCSGVAGPMRSRAYNDRCTAARRRLACKFTWISTAVLTYFAYHTETLQQLQLTVHVYCTSKSSDDATDLKRSLHECRGLTASLAGTQRDSLSL